MSAVADIYRGKTLVGHLRWQGAEIVLEQARPEWISVHLPGSAIPYRGSHLPPFFLNLLPEGARLQLLLDSAKSKDDELELLLRTGWDTVGDISVVPSGQPLNTIKVATISKDCSELDFWEEFRKGATVDAAVPGVQEKLSDATVTLPFSLRDTPSAILKLEPPKFPNIISNEKFFMDLAQKCGLKVAKTRIIFDRNGNKGLLVTRFDRIRNGDTLEKLHQEDGCQLLNFPPAQKYKAPLRSIADQIMAIASAPTVEIMRLVNLLTYSYIIGNGDLHAKNISLLWNKNVTLSPAYDLLSTIPYPVDQGMALLLNGKDKNLKLTDFVDFASRYGVPAEAVTKSTYRMMKTIELHLPDIAEIGFDEKATQRMRSEIAHRLADLNR